MTIEQDQSDGRCRSVKPATGDILRRHDLRCNLTAGHAGRHLALYPTHASDPNPESWTTTWADTDGDR